MSSNFLLVLSGPSGAGKSTLVRKLLAARDDFVYSISATTRPPRAGEVEGRDYFFVSEDRFQEMIKAGELIEWARVFDRFYYGTPRAFISETLTRSRIVTDVDVQGGMQIMKQFPQALCVFIQVEDRAILEQRIRSRGAMKEDELQARLSEAIREMEYRKHYHHVITNHNLDTAFAELQAIIENHPGGVKR